jgi:hypothetical protein
MKDKGKEEFNEQIPKYEGVLNTFGEVANVTSTSDSIVAIRSVGQMDTLFACGITVIDGTGYIVATGVKSSLTLT